ncbi:DUF536 domain-containing protein [Enterococcus hirae]|uniref:DUF536 domain-containing protein n=1 Tax=Enterococcus hirae TaxID=1354 RepID=UPI002DB61E34|nr:DUF536 domain-containing protein [Enterococcus hirae]EMF0144901.1 DUF536 domain-containing protein [Enterococcus hirae]MEB7441131.1 DUF536 domain-containing protein [Enterococcus hirae]
MAEKTIKELAEELGVSKTAISKKVSDENRKLWFVKIGNKFLINEVGQKAIKSMFISENANLNQQPVVEKSQTANQVPELELLSFLKKQLNQKDIQLQEKDEQLKQMQKLLDQQQQLTLQVNKQIESLQEQLQLTFEEETPDFERNTSSEPIGPVDRSKKWWQFWQ